MDADGQEAHIAPRREPNTFAPVRPDALHCYGVDFLSTKEVVDLFRAYSPKHVEWLDDSSCNLVFESEEATRSCLQGVAETAGLDAEAAPLMDSGDGQWTRTRPLKLRQQEEQKGKKPGQARKRAEREYRLQLRLASEADCKDPGHSGHTDSVYYNYVKEQQALQKQAVVDRRLKKRQRQSRLPGAAAQDDADCLEDDSWADGMTDAVQPPAAAKPAAAPLAPSPFAAKADGEGGATAAEGAPGPFAATSSAAASSPFAAADAAAAGPLRLGLRSALDPLAFLRAPASAAAANSTSEEENKRKDEDLRSALRRAEEEFTSLLVPAQAPEAQAAAGPSAARSAGRGRRRALGRLAPLRAPLGEPEAPTEAGTSAASASAQPRGKKRRPVEQEPRPVSSAEPPKRRADALPEVENFLAKHRVRCQRFRIYRTFRSITYDMQHRRKKAELARKEQAEKKEPSAQPGDSDMKDAEAKDAKASDDSIKPVLRDASGQELPPWDQYLQSNYVFSKTGHFVHTIAYESNGRHILAAVPHPMRIDLEKVARAVQRSKETLKLRKLAELASSTGFPVFVCPPFGHPKDKDGLEPILLVDSTVTEMKRPLLFDCGSVGLSIPVSEFFRCTGAACIEGLGKAQDVGDAASKKGVQRQQAPQEPAQRSPTPALEPAPEPAPVPPPPGTWKPGMATTPGNADGAPAKDEAMAA